MSELKSSIFEVTRINQHGHEFKKDRLSIICEECDDNPDITCDYCSIGDSD